MKKLFSIVVVTYNQEKLIKECLDSILLSDYQPLELIVVDDHSTDDNKNIINRWIEKNKSRFSNINFIINEENKGVSYSHTVGVRSASGEYIKYIAGDDILAEKAIDKVGSFLDENKNVYWGFGRIKPFYTDNNGKRFFLKERPEKSLIKYYGIDSKKQINIIFRKNLMHSPGNFFRKGILEEVGYFGEEIRRFEDFHTWFKLLNQGTSFYYLDKLLVYWRRHEGSITFSVYNKDDKILIEDKLNLNKNYLQPKMDKLDILTKIHVKNTYLYWKILSKNESNIKGHHEAKYVKLLDPIWWVSLPTYLKAKFSRK